MSLADMYRDMIAMDGFAEDISITSPDATEAVMMRGIYDRRVIAGQIAGSEVRDGDHLVGVLDEDLPTWIGPGSRVDIAGRAHALQVTALEPDGQGWTYLVCRSAK
jgi:hypothetical protein